MSETTKTLSLRHRPSSTRWLTTFNVLVALGLCLVSGIMLLDMRREAGERADLTARNLVDVLGRDIARTFELYDLSLRAIVDGMKIPAVRNADPETRQLALFDRSASASNLGKILVLDTNGEKILSSQPSPSYNGRHREYFRHHAMQDDPNLFISKPLISTVSGRWGIPVSRRMQNSDGSFAGIVVGVIYLDYFRQLFDALTVQNGITVTLFAQDGTILMRSPFKESEIGQSVTQTESYGRMAALKTGSFRGDAMIGNDLRSFTFGQPGSLPMTLSIAVPLHTIYAGWWHKALTLGSVVVLLCSGTVVLTWLLQRELIQRRRAEQATAALNAELQTLAITDPLTGLSNRRRFDEVLDRDLQRAARRGLPLSLLLLDADFFKRFNDRYGHQCGDEALRVVARAMEAAARQSGDTLCRIGGEEFAIILPETDLAGAAIVAARVREALITRALPHEDNPHHVLTVSIGGADMAMSATPESLVAAADAALYTAKNEGRNRIHMAGREASSPPRPNLRLVGR